MIGLFFAFAFFVRPDLPVLEHVGVGIAVLVVGLVLFGLRLLSAGDVKLLAAVAVWAGPLHILPVIFVVTVLGALLAVVILQVKRFHRLAGANGVPPFISQLIPNWARHGLCPYALAISAGGLFLLPVMFV